MTLYRVTIRHGRPPRYHVMDVEAESLRDALRLTVERMPGDVAAAGDLAEVRTQADPETREYSPG